MKLINDDCLKIIPLLDNIDLVVTPPYNVGNNKYNKNPYSLYKDNKEHKEYINWLKGRFSLIFIQNLKKVAESV